jgi:serine protease AprX
MEDLTMLFDFHRGTPRQSQARSSIIRSRWRTLTVVFSLAGAACLVTIPSSAATPDLAKCDEYTRSELTRTTKSGWTRVIVTTEAELTAGHKDQLKALQVDITRRFTVIRGFAASVPRRNLGKLVDLSFVKHVSMDTDVKKTDEFTVPDTGADVAFAQYGLKGTGIGVAVVDSGVYSGHYDLKSATGISRVKYAKNFVTGETTTVDSIGHGTHVAGIIAGNGMMSSQTGTTHHYYGIARDANIISLRVLNAQGVGRTSDVIAAIQWAVTNKKTYNIKVMNLSLGRAPGDSYVNDPLCQACETAWKNGIVVVCAAGNGGRANLVQVPGDSNEGYGTNYGSIASPGNDPYVITVGAMKQDASYPGIRASDQVATYSARGPSRLDMIVKPDIMAPGNRVIAPRYGTAYLAMTYDASNAVTPSTYWPTAPAGTATQYFKLSGTSMAAPVVAGAAVLLLQKYPTLSPDAVKARLMVSADKWTQADGTGDVLTYGAGMLNIPAALNSTVTPTQYALSPRLVRDLLGNVQISMDSSFWGTQAIWGTGVNDLRAIWGVQAIWGVNTLSSSQAIWGLGIWVDQAIWGTGNAVVDLTDKVINGEQ